MIAVSSMYPDQDTDHAPLVLIHGAANSAKVWTVWQQELAEHGWASHAIELRGHGQSPPFDLSRTTMEDYANDVREVAGRLSQPPVVMGWSMGGLIGMMVASKGLGVTCVALAPSMPARQLDTSVDLRPGEIGLRKSTGSWMVTLTTSLQCPIWIRRSAVWLLVLSVVNRAWLAIKEGRASLLSRSSVHSSS